MESFDLAVKSGLNRCQSKGAATGKRLRNPYQIRVLGSTGRGALCFRGLRRLLFLLFYRGKQTADFLRLPCFAVCLAFLIFFVVLSLPRI